MGFGAAHTFTLSLSNSHITHTYTFSLCQVDNRFVLTYGVLHFTYEAEEGDPWSHIVVCVSAGNNPLADWTCWALDARLMVVAPNGYLCDGMGKGSFLAGSPTVSAPGATAAFCDERRAVGAGVAMRGATAQIQQPGYAW